MKIRGNTVGTPIKPDRVIVKAAENTDNKVFSNASFTYGENNQVGLRGYYYYHGNDSEYSPVFDTTNKTLTLYLFNDQACTVPAKDIAWEADDVVSIVNGGKYEECAAIATINGNVLTLDSLPFDSVATESSPNVDDWSIYVLDKPDKGVADLGKGAVAIGLSNKASNWCAVAIGKDNETTAQHSMAIGRKNKVHAYAGFASGYRNTVHPNAKYGRASGLDCEAKGEISVAEGELNDAVGKGSVAQGKETTANGNYSHTIGAKTTANGVYSFAGGNGTVANADYSHVVGMYNTSKWQGQFVAGKYNEDPKAIEVLTVGCGTSKDDRKNAFGVKLDGTTDVYGHKITNVALGESATDAVNKGQLDAIKVGGRNYALNSKGDKTTTNQQVASYTLSETIAENEQLVITICVSPGNFRGYFAPCADDGTMGLGGKAEIKSGTEKQIFHFRTPMLYGTNGGKTISIHKKNNDNSMNYSDSVTVHWCKIEKGNKPTDWTPAPEDAVSSGHTHTKEQVGLGNVDNTADADKNVNYANSAGSAGRVEWNNVQNKPAVNMVREFKSGVISTKSYKVTTNAAKIYTILATDGKAYYSGTVDWQALNAGFTTYNIGNIVVSILLNGTSITFQCAGDSETMLKYICGYY